MPIAALLEKLKYEPDRIEFDEVMAMIARCYDYSPCRFSNGALVNAAGSNEGSCRIFAFASLAGLDERSTLACFGKYYRDDVLGHPDGVDHANIRQFMQTGWHGITFTKNALQSKERVVAP